MNKINQYNQWLLERYPNIWNTRFVWMLLISFLMHILFFVIGYVSFTNPKYLQENHTINNYFTSGIVVVHIIVSILLLVGWLITMFKNNAFKNFYPVSRGRLFFQFLQYFIIILASTTFYFSYMLGYKTFINNTYDDAKISKVIKTSNMAAAFLPYNYQDYLLNNKLSPDIFEKFYCENNLNKIDRTKPYFTYYDQVYQFYTLEKISTKKKSKDGEFILPIKNGKSYGEPVYSYINNDVITYYFKKDWVDVSSYISSAKPNFSNYSSVLFFDSDYPYYYKNNHLSENTEAFNDDFKAARIEVSKNVNSLLNDNSPKVLENFLSEFLAYSKDFKIETNLNVNDWMRLIKKTENNEVGFFINRYEQNHEINYDEVAVESVSMPDVYSDNTSQKELLRQLNPNIDNEVSPQKMKSKFTVNFYYDDKSLENLLINVREIKTKNIFETNIHVFFWISFSIAAFLFSFRIAGLRPLLFSIISFGVISLGIILMSVISAVSGGQESKYFVSYLCLIVGLAILFISILGNKKSKNNPATIAMIIMINTFPICVFLVFGIIDLHQQALCNSQSELKIYKPCNTILDQLDIYTSYIILGASFIFMYFYTSLIQKWKSLPE